MDQTGDVHDHNYGDRVVGFVDILGFGSLVMQAHKDPALRRQIKEALGRVQDIASPRPDEVTNLRAQNFSDSLILSADKTADGLWHLLLSLAALSWNLVQMGIMVRGGVVVGSIFQDEHVVFGPAVNEAYRLESTVAQGPRIILGASALQAAASYSQEDEIWQTYHHSRLKRDHDGVWYLNFLCEAGIFNKQSSSSSALEKHPMYVVLSNLRDLLQQKLDSTLDKPEVYAKLRWLAQYWNEEVAGIARDGNRTAIGPIALAGQETQHIKLPFRAHGII